MPLLKNPFAGNPFCSRADAQQAVRSTFEPLVPAFRAGGARVDLGNTASSNDLAADHLEAFARPLWGIVPLAAGGGEFEHWDLIRAALVEGTDPRHPRFWGMVPGTSGAPYEPDQRMVEMAAVGFALALVPQLIYEPLSRAEQKRLTTWLAPINRYPLVRNNWQFFRVLVNLGFHRVGGPIDAPALRESLELIDSHWLGSGWYRDGVSPGHVDHYIGWAYHFYGLIFAALGDDLDRDRCARFRARAVEFADEFEVWFDRVGRVVPYGRSMTYRFAAASYWGALAFSGDEALPWSRVRGLWARHLRWWGTQPIARGDGVLSVGYAYENVLTADRYNAPGSPYWALKAFLPLALAPDAPLWQATEAPAESMGSKHAVVRPAVAIISRDCQQTQLLIGGRGEWTGRHGGAKYGKFAYSSAFGFSVDPDDADYVDITDSVLVLVDEEGVSRSRARVLSSGADDDAVWSIWQPFRDVAVTTVLFGSAPWHVRLHRVVTRRDVMSNECGFAIGYDGGDPAEPPIHTVVDAGHALVTTRAGTSVIADPLGGRQARIRPIQPNTNLVAPRALVPVLTRRLSAGVHRLACVVGAVEAPDELDPSTGPFVPDSAWQLLDRHSAVI